MTPTTIEMVLLVVRLASGTFEGTYMDTLQDCKTAQRLALDLSRDVVKAECYVDGKLESIIEPAKE